MSDEFYLGWEGKAPAALGRYVRRAALALVLGSLILGALLASAQRTVETSVFEWGRIREFHGILQANPVPHLLVHRPAGAPAAQAFSTYHLVNPFKFGLDPAAARALDGRRVRLSGTLIHRDHQMMIEVVPGSLQAASPGASSSLPSPSVSLGEATLVGEIVDSKCYLGVMNPGRFIPHRACAIRCVSGGIPPMLVVSQLNAPPLCYLLVARDGGRLNQAVLGLIAEPVSVTGEVRRQGDLLTLLADPSEIRRLPR